jgi:hypothetical protein
MVFLLEGDGYLGPLEPRQGGEGVDGVHLLFGDTALSAGFIRLGAPKDHEAVLGLEELVVFLLGTACWVTDLRSRPLGLAILAEGCYGCSPLWWHSPWEDALPAPYGMDRGIRAPSRSVLAV